MELTTITIALALLEYTVFTMLCGRARARCGIVAPATSGDPTFERYFRVQQNSVEQLIIFVPAMLLFGHYVSAPIGAGLGLVFILGRALFAAVTTKILQNGPSVSASRCSRIWCCCSED